MCNLCNLVVAPLTLRLAILMCFDPSLTLAINTIDCSVQLHEWFCTIFTACMMSYDFCPQEPTPPVVVSTPPITVVCNCDSTRTHPSIVVSPGCSHQLRFLPTGQLVRPTEDPPAQQVSVQCMLKYCVLHVVLCSQSIVSYLLLAMSLCML